MTGAQNFLDQQNAVELADERAAPGTAILVLGSQLSWHDQFWSFQWSDRPFFFNDWLWYWQKDHFGEYNPDTEHAYPDPLTTLDAAYLQTHGIGAVVASPQFAAGVAQSPFLDPVSVSSSYAVYLVKDPTEIITADGAVVTAISIENQTFEADVSQPSTVFEIRRNWFPRWTATVDGKPATITKDANGYMVVTSSTPGTHVEVVYGVDSWDWMGRILLVLGIVSAAAALLQPRRIEQLLRIEPLAPG